MKNTLTKGAEFEVISIKCLRCQTPFTTEIPVPSFVCSCCRNKMAKRKTFSTLYKIFKQPLGNYYIEKITCCSRDDSPLEMTEFYGSHEDLDTLRTYLPKEKRRVSENWNRDTGLVEIWSS